METTMGRVLVTAKIENLYDVEQRERGLLSADEVRSVEVNDALIDTGATGLLLPMRLIDQLGLRPYKTRPSRGIAGETSLTIYSAVRMTIQGRDCLSDVVEIADGLHVLIGQVPLELLDFLVDPKGQKLVGNLVHGGEQMMEVFWL
ncbi:MAG TPA: aspartyl protease family protein [Pirellulales bacterium]|jgi:predicted aspartyl protease|nr:aspartyl protease family protein [Pirellulales bacterium]